MSVLSHTAALPVGIINTRPANRAGELTQYMLDRQVNVLSMPLLSINRLDSNFSLPINALTMRSTVIVLSPSAAEYGVQALTGLGVNKSRNWQWIAVGQATANILTLAGITAVTPSQSNSEGILAMSDFTNAEHIWIWRGEGGRKLIDQKIIQQQRPHGSVSEWRLYNRICPTNLNEQWQQVIASADNRSHAILITSVESWANFKTAAQGLAFYYPIIAMGDRVADEIKAEHLTSSRADLLIIAITPDLKPESIYQQLLHLFR